MVDVLSTFIWQATVVHSLDHMTYYSLIAKALKGSCMSISIPYEPFNNFKFWSGIEEKLNVSIQDIKKNPKESVMHNERNLIN